MYILERERSTLRSRRHRSMRDLLRPRQTCGMNSAHHDERSGCGSSAVRTRDAYSSALADERSVRHRFVLSTGTVDGLCANVWIGRFVRDERRTQAACL